eukprot:6631435-Lingulodinium_polyedra.AAC.1
MRAPFALRPCWRWTCRASFLRLARAAVLARRQQPVGGARPRRVGRGSAECPATRARLRRSC